MAVTPVLCEFNNIFLGNVICHLMAYLEVIELLFVHAFNEKPVSIDIPGCQIIDFSVRTFSAPAVIRMLCCLSNPLPDIGVNFFSGTAVPAAFLLPAFFCYFFLPFLYFLIFLCQSFSSVCCCSSLCCLSLSSFAVCRLSSASSSVRRCTSIFSRNSVKCWESGTSGPRPSTRVIRTK